MNGSVKNAYVEDEMNLRALSLAVAVLVATGYGVAGLVRSDAARQGRAAVVSEADTSTRSDLETLQAHFSQPFDTPLAPQAVDDVTRVLVHVNRNELWKPAKQSHAVLVGTVLDQEAFLTARGEAIFTVYQVEVERILKGSARREISPGSRIEVARLGGNLYLPSGKTVEYRHGEVLAVGGRFLLYLWEIDGAAVFEAKTGSELANGLASKLDSSARSNVKPSEAEALAAAEAEIQAQKGKE
jgi:hypothetical protein